MLDNVNFTLYFRDPTGSHSDFNIRCGIINRMSWDSSNSNNSIPIYPPDGTPAIGWEAGVTTANATDLRTLNGTVAKNVDYDVYIGSYADSNKLENVVARWTGSWGLDYAQDLRFYDTETYTYFRCVAEWYDREEILRPYLCINLTGISSLDIPTDINKANFKQVILNYFKTYFNGTLRYEHGMDREHCFFVMMQTTADTLYNSKNAAVGQSGAFTNIKSYADFYRFFTGEFLIKPNYFTLPDDSKIYTSVFISPPVNHTVFHDDVSVLDIIEPRTECKPYVGWNVQTGTNLGKYFTSYNTNIMLKNGSTITLKKQQNPHSNDANNAFKCSIEFANRVDPENVIVLESSFNMAGMDIATRLSDTTNFNGMYCDSYYTEKSHGIYIIETPNSETGNISEYIDENEGADADFWDRYPTAPITIGYQICEPWYTTVNNYALNVTSYINTELGNSIACGFYTVCNQLGFKPGAQYIEMQYVRYLGMTVKIPYESGMSSADAAILPILGEFSVGSGENYYILLGVSSAIDPEDPNHGGGSIGGGGGSGGGGGHFDDNSDSIYIPPVPRTIEGKTFDYRNMGHFNNQFTDGFLSTRLDDLADYLNDTNIFHSFDERVEGVQSLKIIYGYGTPTVATSTQVTIRGSEVPGLVCEKITSRYKRINLGSFNINEYFGSFLDYGPYTNIQLYLPFSGLYNIDPSLVVGAVDCELHALQDFYTGDIVYTLSVAKGTMEAVVYTFSGNTASDLPLTLTDYTNKIDAAKNILIGAGSVAASIIGAVATEGAATPMAVMGITGGAASIGSGVKDAMKGSSGGRTVGTISGSKGIMSITKPYLIITRPKVVEARDYGSIYGYPCMLSYKLGDLSGYVLVGDCNWSIPGATEEEIDEINNLMKTEGAIL